MIVLEGVSYRYAGASRAAIRDIALEVRDGAVLGVVGGNEAGKSTLCMVAAGLAPQVVGGRLAGRVLVDGAPLDGQPVHAVVARVAMGFQNPATQLSGVCETVYEEVSFGPANLGLPLAEVLTATEEALEALAIGDLAARHPGRLSGGQQQLVAMAGLLAMGARNLVLDEPTAQLDPHGTALVAAAVEALAAAGVAILVTEHKTDLLARICSRVLVLERGKMALDGEADAVLADERLPALGVAPPSAVRLRRLARASGVSLDEGSA